MRLCLERIVTNFFLASIIERTRLRDYAAEFLIFWIPFIDILQRGDRSNGLTLTFFSVNNNNE